MLVWGVLEGLECGTGANNDRWRMRHGTAWVSSCSEHCTMGPLLRESARVSIAGRSTASIIDEKLPLARFSNLARLQRGMHARHGSSDAEHFAQPFEAESGGG